MKYLAHISKDGTREQCILDHCKNVAALARDFAEVFGAGSWGYCCGMVHDIGKYTEAFQKRLYGGERVDHATAGAKVLKEKGGLYEMAAYCVAGHHAGLPDKGTEADTAQKGTLCGRWKKTLFDYQDYQKEIEIPPLNVPSICPLKESGGYSVSFFIRMIYSCLVDADFLDTESFMTNDCIDRQPGRVSIELLERLIKYIEPWMKDTDLMTINGRRTQILKSCLEQGKEEAGFFSLTVPTGGGKTISSLAFALQHACTHGKNRVIYVIPYTSIIEQNAQVFREILGETNVLENHSNVQYDDQEEFRLMQLAAENWDKPVVVTTNVQFFESVFSNRSSKCRKLHNIANSVIIFDEVQMLPVYYLRPCIRAMIELVENYRCSIVLCTATQPSFQKFFQRKIKELCPEVEEQFRFFRRTTVEKMGVVEEKDLIDQIRVEKQVLCILNHRKRVQKLYKQMQEEGVYHLSTLMYPLHRKRKLQEIRERLKQGKKCIVFATSLVEAGVDLDFQNVYRELIGIDSVVQAAGRCNREGKFSATDSKTYVFEFAETMQTANELKQALGIAKVVAKQYPDITSLDAIEAYFTQLYDMKGDSLDQKQILKQFEKYKESGSYPFATVAKQFRLIETNTKQVVIGIEEQAKEQIQKLRAGERSRILMREVGLYSIQIYEDDFERLRAAGCLEELDEEIALLRDFKKYSEEVGLQLDVTSAEAVFI